MNLDNMGFNQKFQLLTSDTKFVISKKTGKIDTGYDKKTFGNLRAKIASQISHIPFLGKKEIKRGKKAQQLLIEDCKADLKAMHNLIKDPETGLKKQYADLKIATGQEFSDKFKELSEKVDKIEKEYLACITDHELRTHLFPDPKDEFAMKDLMEDLNKIKQIHKDLSQFKEIEGIIKNFNPSSYDKNPFSLYRTLEKIALTDDNIEFLEHFGKTISHMVVEQVKQNPSQYEANIPSLRQIAKYCEGDDVDTQAFIKKCGLKIEVPKTKDVEEKPLFEERGVFLPEFEERPIFEEREVDNPHPITNFFQNIARGFTDLTDFFSESTWDLGDFLITETEKASISNAEVLDTLKMASPTFARNVENKNDPEQILKETLQELELSLGSTIFEIQKNRVEINSLNSALESIREELPNSLYLSSAQTRLNEMDSSLALRGELLRLNDQMRAKSALVEEPIYSRPQSMQSHQPIGEYSYKEPSHSETAAALSSVLSLAKDNYMMFITPDKNLTDKQNQKLNNDYRIQFEQCLKDLKEIEKPTVPMTKSWCEQKIEEMEHLSSLAKVEGTHQVRYSTDPFDTYKHQLQTQVSLFNQVEHLESLFPHAKVESANLEERANVLISRISRLLASETKANSDLETKVEKALTQIGITGLLQPGLVENSLNVLSDLKLQRQLLENIQKNFPGVVSGTNVTLEKTLHQIAQLEIPNDATLIPQFAENIQHVRRHITNIATHMSQPPANYSEVVSQLKNTEQQIQQIETKLLGITGPTIKAQLEEIRKAENTSLEAFQKMNLEAVKVITQSLISIPAEASANGFSTRLALMQEVLTHFENMPGMEKEITELKMAMNNFNGTKQALQVLEGKKSDPQTILANQKSDTFEIAQDVVTKKAKEQWKEYNQKLDNIKSGQLSQTVSLEEFKEASIIADRLMMTATKLGEFIENAEELKQTVAATHQQFQNEFIEHTINSLNLSPDQLIHNLSSLPKVLPGNLIVPENAISQLIDRTLENVREETPLATLMKQKELLQACVEKEMGGQVSAQKLGNYNDLINKLESFSEHPIENLKIIQLMLDRDRYPKSAIFALDHQVTHLLISLETNPGINSSQLQATHQLLEQIHVTLAREEFEPLKQAALEIQENLGNVQEAIHQLTSIKSQFEAAEGEDKLHFAEQFCAVLIQSEGALSKFPNVSESFTNAFSAAIHENLKVVKNSVRSEFQSYTASALTQEESANMFERAHLYAETYAALVSIVKDSPESVNKAMGKLEKFSSEVTQVRRDIRGDIQDVQNRQSVLEKRLDELEEKRETFAFPQSLSEKVDELADLYDAARDEKGHFPAGLSLPPSFDYSAPTASLLTHEPLKASCEKQIGQLQQELKYTGLDKQEAEQTIANLKKQEAKLSEHFDVKIFIQGIIQSYGLEEKENQPQEYFEQKYAEKLALFESEQNVLSQAGAWFSKLGASAQEIAGTITTGQTGKQAELARLESTYGQQLPKELLGLASIIDTFSGHKTQERKNQEELANITAQIQKQEALLEKLDASSKKDEMTLNRLENLQKAILLSSSPYEKGQSVIKTIEDKINALNTHELKIQTTKSRLEALSHHEEMLGNVLGQSFVMGRFGSAKEAINGMHQIIQLIGKEDLSKNKLALYGQLKKINEECRKDPIFQKLLIPYRSQLIELDKELNLG